MSRNKKFKVSWNKLASVSEVQSGAWCKLNPRERYRSTLVKTSKSKSFELDLGGMAVSRC